MALAWTKEYMKAPDDLRIAAVLRCGTKDCKTIGRIPVGAFGDKPEWIRKLFERRGWEVDQHNQSRCVCPTCIKGRRARRESVKIIKHEPVVAAARVLPAEPVKRLVEELKMPPVDIRSIPAADKTKMRQILDSHFDDAAGIYIDGYSDAKVAAELNLPRATVFAYREATYGPLKRDPELDEFLAGLDEVKKKMADLQSDIAKLDVKAAACIKRLGL